MVTSDFEYHGLLGTINKILINQAECARLFATTVILPERHIHAILLMGSVHYHGARIINYIIGEYALD